MTPEASKVMENELKRVSGVKFEEHMRRKERELKQTTPYPWQVDLANAKPNE
jgi:hypothetical protein